MKTTTSDYSDYSFWKKLLKHAALMGYDICVLALTLYFALIDSATPIWARTILRLFSLSDRPS